MMSRACAPYDCFARIPDSSRIMPPRGFEDRGADHAGLPLTPAWRVRHGNIFHHGFVVAVPRCILLAMVDGEDPDRCPDQKTSLKSLWRMGYLPHGSKKGQGRGAKTPIHRITQTSAGHARQTRVFGPCPVCRAVVSNSARACLAHLLGHLSDRRSSRVSMAFHATCSIRRVGNGFAIGIPDSMAERCDMRLSGVSRFPPLCPMRV